MYQGKYQNAKDAPSTPPRRRAPAKKAVSMGTKVYYCTLLAVILLFFVAMTFVMSALKDWLISFEASQPHTKCQEVFTQLFADPDWQELYVLAGVEDNQFVTKEAYASYMEKTIGDAELNYIETSAGLSGDKKYIVRKDTQKVATFTLTNADKDADIPDWQLGTIEVFFEQNSDCTIVTVPGYTVTVNGMVLDDSYVMRTVSTKAENYLPEGIHGYQLAELYIGGMLAEPEVVVTDTQGQPVELTYNAETRTYSHALTSAAISDSEHDILLNAATTYCKYMIGAVGKAELRKCFDSSSQIYNTITTNDTWMQSYAGYDFGEESITDYYRYSDDLYSARITLMLNVNRKDGTVKEYELANTFFLEKGQNGNWLVTEMINSNAQEQISNVRLTYMVDDTVLLSEMVNADTGTLTSPAVTVPEGKVFSGWFTETVDVSGNKTMTLAFLPDANGIVSLPLDNVLEPMTLHALFEAEGA